MSFESTFKYLFPLLLFSFPLLYYFLFGITSNNPTAEDKNMLKEEGGFCMVQSLSKFAATTPELGIHYFLLKL